MERQSCLKDTSCVKEIAFADYDAGAARINQ